MTRRKYTLRKRARQQEQTRERIVQAIVDLHEEVGPARTTVSAIAERAGVQRLTVYRHFPDESAMLQACTSHWMAENPPPDPRGWASIADPLQRTHRALEQLYDYYRRTERMWTSSYRDLEQVDALAQYMEPVEAYLEGIRRDLIAAFDVPSGSPLDLALAHAVQFATWKSLHEIADDEMAVLDLMMDWVECLHRRAMAP